MQMVLTAPRNIYEELFERRKAESHALQNLSLCGRKVVSWSDKINFNDVAKICKTKHITPNEVYFSAVSSALFTFSEEYKAMVPSNLSACARYVEKDCLFGHANYSEGNVNYSKSLISFFIRHCVMNSISLKIATQFETNLNLKLCSKE